MGQGNLTQIDVKFYLAAHLDLEHAFGTNYVAATDHWITTGMAEGRTGAPPDG